MSERTFNVLQVFTGIGGPMTWPLGDALDERAYEADLERAQS